MATFVAQNMAPIMFMALVVFLLLGYPVAFSLAAVGLIFGFIGVEVGLFQPDFLQALPERVYGIMANDTLLAIPFFTFMGLILERSGMAEDLLDTIGQLFGTVRGGLAYAVIFVGALLAATTGVVAASVISMGLISLPIMLRYGYDRRLASGVIAAQLGRSVGDMYEGAFLPGIILAGLYAVYVLIMTVAFPKSAPGLPNEAIGFREPDGARGVWQLGVLVLFSGIVGYYVLSQTDTKAGADFVILTICIATVVALVCAVMNRFLGAKRLAVSAALAVVLVAAQYWLRRNGYPGWGLFVEMLAAASIYALVVGLVERLTGLRLM